MRNETAPTEAKTRVRVERHAGKRVLQSIKSEDTYSDGKSVGYKHYEEWGSRLIHAIAKRIRRCDESKDGLLVPKTLTEGPQTLT